MKRMNRIGVMLGLLSWAVVAVVLTSCSFKLEMGYHGQTGRDDRVQTELLQERRDKEKGRY